MHGMGHDDYAKAPLKIPQKITPYIFRVIVI